MYEGKLHLDMGNMTDAEAALSVALDLSRNGDLNVYRSCLCDLGSVCHQTGQHEKALTYLKECVDVNERVQDLAGLLKAYTNLVGLYRSMRRSDEAKEAMAKVADLSGLLQTRGIGKGS